MPYLSAALIQDMAANLGGCDTLIPEINRHLQILHAFYNKRKLPPIAEELLRLGDTSVYALALRCRVIKLGKDYFRTHADGLKSFRDLNTAAEYQHAINETGDSAAE